MVTALALSRIYIGVHYPTDVVAAVVTASAAVMLFSGLWNRHAAGILARLRFLGTVRPDSRCAPPLMVARAESSGCCPAVGPIVGRPARFG